MTSDYSNKDAKWHIEYILSKALIIAKSSLKGPVHINIPIREPIYLDLNSKIKTPDKIITAIRGIVKLTDYDIASLKKKMLESQ